MVEQNIVDWRKELASESGDSPARKVPVRAVLATLDKKKE